MAVPKKTQLSTYTKRIRKSFSRMPGSMPVPDLVELQKKSYDEFLQSNVKPENRTDAGLHGVFLSVFPIADNSGKFKLEFCKYILEEPKYTVKEAKHKGVMYAAQLRVTFKLTAYDYSADKAKNIKSINEQDVYLGDMPMMTPSGTFVINGAERVVVSQMHKSPGVFFARDVASGSVSGKHIFVARVVPDRGSWLDFEYDPKDYMYFRIDKRRKVPVTTLLRALYSAKTEKLLSAAGVACYYATVATDANANASTNNEEGKGKSPSVAYRNVQGMSKEEILHYFYRNVEYSRVAEQWQTAFVPDSWRGVKLTKPLIDAQTGKCVAEEGIKITERVMRQLKEQNLQSIVVNKSDVIGRYMYYDIVDATNGKMLCEAGDIITEALLDELLKHGMNSVATLNIDYLKVGPYIRDTLVHDKNLTREEALFEIYRIMRPGEPPTVDSADALFHGLFFDKSRYSLSHVGRMKMNVRLGRNHGFDDMVLCKNDILQVVRTLFELRDGHGKIDDIDSLENRRIRAVGELLENQYRTGLIRMQRAIRERMSVVNPEGATPQDFINSKPLVSVIREFFGTSQLSQFMDQVNPLSEVNHKRRLSALGPGGLNRGRAGIEVRDVHPSQYCKICPIETPEGSNIGLISSLAVFSKVNEFGFLTTPYFKVAHGKITHETIYLSVMHEQDRNIAQSIAKIGEDGAFLEDFVPCRCNGEIVFVPPSEVHFSEISPMQMVSIAASLIPFVENDDVARALMGSNMQRQAVPLLRASAPLIGTGMEGVVARDSMAVVTAKRGGVIDYVDASCIVVRTNDEITSEGQVVDMYSLVKFEKSNSNTCINQKPIVNIGDIVEAGDVIADGYATQNGELALGDNIVAAFLSSEGRVFEDSILISEKIVKDDVFTSIHIEEYEVYARDTKNGQEEIVRNVPGNTEEALRYLDETGIICVGAEVKAGDILVGKITPKGSEVSVTPEERLLRAIFGEKVSDVKDTSLRVPPGVYGTVINVRVFSRKGTDKGDRLLSIENAEIEQINKKRNAERAILDRSFREALRNCLVGQELSSGVANIKVGTVITDDLLNDVPVRVLASVTLKNSKPTKQIQILKQQYESALHDLEKRFEDQVEKVRRGHELPSGVLKVVKVFIAVKRKLQVGDKMAGRHGNKGVVAAVVPIEDMPYLADGTPVDMVLNPLGLPSRMNLGQIFETHLGWAAAGFGKQIRHILENLSQSYGQGYGQNYEQSYAGNTGSNDENNGENNREQDHEQNHGKNRGKNLEQASENREQGNGQGNGQANGQEHNKNLEQAGMQELRAKLKQIYETDPIAKDLDTMSDSAVVALASSLDNGIPMASPVFDGAKDADISRMLEAAGLHKSGQVTLYDGKTGEPFDRPSTIGVIYMMKLRHLVDEKIHARSVGPYSLITQQPLGGKAQFGGQRLGEMEVWALQAYGAAYTLKEMLTVKSDDMYGRKKFYEATVNGQEFFEAGSPESFNVLVRELMGLGLNVECLQDRAEHVEASSIRSMFDNSIDNKRFDSLRISIASPEQIRKQSFGEVKKPETINYRTFKPERDGLFCAKIFGPVKDYECLCGKYKRQKFKGVVCEKCGVEVTSSRVRRERMGHIELAYPVAHSWFVRLLPSRIGSLLELNAKDLDNILYFESYVVVEPGLTPLKMHQLLSEHEYVAAQKGYGPESFKAMIGAEALKEMLAAIDLERERDNLREELATCNSEMRRKKIIRRLKLIEAFIDTGVRPEWMIMDVVPVIPPELRPLVLLDGGRFATSDLTELYRKLLNRNNRLKRLIELRAPDIIVNNEKKMLWEITNALFDNNRRGKPVIGSNKRPLKSLSDLLKGKSGRFRQNLLGKRVDYSGRSVIVVGPELKLHQCGLPKKMALELFKPFVYSRLERYGFASTIKVAKRMVERERPEVWDMLEEVIREHPVLLNRAPTLHRLGIQAFEPMLIEGKAIQLHPLVCSSFNADFDGDQMAVHVPLSIEAQLEARVLMMSTNNILSPANGRPIIVPSKDMVLGLYYLSIMRDGEKGEGMQFASIADIESAMLTHLVSLHAKVTVYHKQLFADGSEKLLKINTTPGRVLFSEILPKHPEVTFDLINRTLAAKDIANLIDVVYKYCGQKEAVIFADKLMWLGFKWATKSGISFGKDDLVIPKEKQEYVEEAIRAESEYKQQYLEGLITRGERYNKVTDAWTKCSARVSAAVLENMAKSSPGQHINSIYIMCVSGARGSVAQLNQLIGMKGLLANHKGDIMPDAVVSNLKDGLKPLEYFNSTTGARKGLSDTALKTADSGYLTRRLVDVAQDCIIEELDCGTQEGITVKAVVEGEEVIASLGERVLGRVTAGELVESVSGKVLLPHNTVISDAELAVIQDNGIEAVRIRSPLRCKARSGVCAYCYGKDLSKGEVISIGEAVGVIAAQSIGEPGTQLTLQTFHSGGAAKRAEEQSLVYAAFDGIVTYKGKATVVNRHGVTVVTSRHMELLLINKDNKQKAVYSIPYGAHVYFDESVIVKKGVKLAEWDPYTVPIITDLSGTVQYVDLIPNVSVKEIVDEATGISKRIVSDWKQSARSTEIKPMILLKDKNGNPIVVAGGIEARYLLSPDAIVMVDNNAEVVTGDVVAKLPKESFKSRDITGGLPRIAELFEARRPKDAAIISEHDGHIAFGKDYKTKRRIILIPLDENIESISYFVPKGQHVLVQEGDEVKKGDLLVDGNFVPHDILRVLGVEALASYLIDEIQEVYRLQGVKINDKHIEIIVRQMLQKIEITDVGDSLCLLGDHIDRNEFNTMNAGITANGGKAAEGEPVLQGITRASLQTPSFISAASFQETTRVLTEAAINGKIDPLRGLKENVMVGRLIPAGTGAVVHKYEELAVSRDVENLKLRTQQQNQ